MLVCTATYVTDMFVLAVCLLLADVYAAKYCIDVHTHGVYNVCWSLYTA